LLHLYQTFHLISTVRIHYFGLC